MPRSNQFCARGNGLPWLSIQISEPATLLLVGMGLVGISALIRKLRQGNKEPLESVLKK